MTPKPFFFFFLVPLMDLIYPIISKFFIGGVIHIFNTHLWMPYFVGGTVSSRNGLMETATLIRRTCLQLSVSLNGEEWCGMKLERWWAEPYRPF